MSAIGLKKEDLLFIEEMVDEANQQFIDSVTPEYVAEQHASQSRWLTKGSDIKAKKHDQSKLI